MHLLDGLMKSGVIRLAKERNVDVMSSKISRYNSSKYPDPTAHAALQSALDEQTEEERRIRKVISTVKNVLDFAGFELMARIEIRDKRTGKIYK